MKKWAEGLILMIVSSGLGAASAADVHQLVGDANDQIWHYVSNNGSHSDSDPGPPPKAVIVDDLKVGDIIEVSRAGKNEPHGFMPITQSANGVLTPTPDPVHGCTDDPNKTGAVLIELDCQPGKTLLGKAVPFGQKMRMQVLSTFKGDVRFWCAIHQGSMLGVLKLKQ